MTDFGLPEVWTLFGGKLHEGESSKDAFMRELFDEIHLRADPQKTEKVAMIYQTKVWPDGNYRRYLFHVFLTHGLLPDSLPRPDGREFEGYRRVNVGALPRWAMCESDLRWYPEIFAGKKIVASVTTHYPGMRIVHECRDFKMREVSGFLW